MRIQWIVGLAALALSAAGFAGDAPSDKYLAGKHVAKGITCQMCHGQKNEIEEPSIKQCTQCHQVDPLVAKTAPRTAGQRNPHMSPHYQKKLECTNCHHGHEAPENFCNQCHKFDFKVK